VITLLSVAGGPIRFSQAIAGGFWPAIPEVSTHMETRQDYRRFALPAVFLLAIVNGLFADIAYAISAPAARLPVSPVLLIIIVACLRLLTSSAPAHGVFRPVAAAMLTLGAILPSSLTSWLVTGMVCAFGVFFDPARRTGYRMTLALALTQIWHASAFKVLATRLTSGETQILAACLWVLGFTPEVDNNLIRVTPDHALVLLSGCSVFSDLGLIILGWLAVFSLTQPAGSFPAKYVPAVAFAAISLNLFRLILMALGPGVHAFVHDGSGAQIYDAAVCLLVISAAWLPDLGNENPERVAAGRQTAQSSRSLPETIARTSSAARGVLARVTRRDAAACALLLAVAFVSLSAKGLRYSAIDGASWKEASDRIKLEATEQGFEFAGQVSMTADHAIEGMIFKKPACAVPLIVGMMGAGSDTLPLIKRYLAGTPVWVYLDGEPVERWAVPRFLAVNIGEIAKSLPRGKKPALHPLIAVSRPAANREARCHWHAAVSQTAAMQLTSAATRAQPAARD
jgi:hypothetical protein